MRKLYIIETEKICYVNPTTVICNDRILTYQKLDIKTAVELWKWYFNIPPFAKIEIHTNRKNYNACNQRMAAETKSAYEIFYDCGVEIKAVKEQADEN